LRRKNGLAEKSNGFGRTENVCSVNRFTPFFGKGSNQIGLRLLEKAPTNSKFALFQAPSAQGAQRPHTRFSKILEIFHFSKCFFEPQTAGSIHH
jgi:hypothetical protein